MISPSLKNKLVQRATIELLIFVSTTGALLSLFLYYQTQGEIDRHVRAWLEPFPKNILPHLIDSDHFAVESKVKMLGSTGLFNSISVVDRLGNFVARFNEGDKKEIFDPKIPVQDKGGEVWGYYSYSLNRNTVWRPIFISISILIGILAGLLLITKYRMKQFIGLKLNEFSNFIGALETLSQSIAAGNKHIIKKLSLSATIEEEARLKSVIGLLVTEIRKSQAEIKRFTRISERRKYEDEKYRIARQIAHDIRTPAEALKLGIESPDFDRETKKLIFRDASQTILDMANEIMDRYRPFSSLETEGDTKLTTELIAPLVERCASLKRIKCSPTVEIVTTFNPIAYELFCKIEKTQFKRAISNLLNNAVDALDFSGKVEIHVEGTADTAEILIKDNGKGIPSEHLTKVFKEGFSFNKENGHGLGLSHSKTILHSWGGDLNITSSIGVGTTIRISIPRVCPPSWHVPEITIYPETQIVILDDDPSIHHIWKQLLKPLNSFLITAPAQFRKSQELFDWHQQLKYRDSALYFVDFELLEKDVDGLAIIQSLGIQSQSILVTNRFEETSIQSRAAKMEVPIVPKEMLRFLPIKLASSDRSQSYVLVDDDPVTRTAWEESAREYGKNLQAFKDRKSFLKSLKSIPHDTTFYIDYFFDGKAEGTEIAKAAYTAGFKNIFLATGYFEALPKFPWIRGVVEKRPPWRKLMNQEGSDIS